MVKKVISAVLATGVFVASISAFACSCGEEYRTYEYNYLNNDRHTVGYHCSYQGCDDQYTDIGTEDCTYEWVEYEDPNTWVVSWVQRCTVCGHIK